MRDVRKLRLACVLLISAALAPAAAHAADGDRLARIRTDGVVRCGGVIRPGLAFPTRAGVWLGLEVDVCRAIAAAVLGPAGRAEFRAYNPEYGFRPVLEHSDDVAFLTAGEIFRGKVGDAIVPGPAVFMESHGVLVPDGSAAKHMADLAGTDICAEPGTGPERSLTAWFADHKLPTRFFPFEESVEMADAYESSNCSGVAQETTSLVGLNLTFTGHGHPGRLLPELLAVFPVLATTPSGDSDWAATVSWAVASLMALEKLDRDVPAGGPDPLPVQAARLGLDPAWQKQMLAAVGSYGDIYERDLGARSPFRIPRGINASWSEGGLLVAPFVD